MRAPVSWLRELVDIPVDQSGRDIAARLIRAGLEVETVETVGGGVVGALYVGKVIEIEELTEFKKPIRWCQVDVGAPGGGIRGIICGATPWSWRCPAPCYPVDLRSPRAKLTVMYLMG